MSLSFVTAQYACEICRERKVGCDRALPKCRRCARLNQQCSYSHSRSRRTRDEQMKQLQERLAKAEAQLALNTPESTSSKHSQLQSEHIEPAVSTGQNETSDPSPSSSRYQWPATTAPEFQSPSFAASTANIAPIDLDNVIESNANVSTQDFPLGSDLFNSFAEETDLSLAWANQHLGALEPLDNMLLDQPHCPAQFGSGEDLSPADLDLLHKQYFDFVYHSFPFVNKDRFMAEKTDADSPAISALIYAVALAGCSHSLQDHHQHMTYKLARNHAEKCEQEDHLNDLNFLQALLMIGRFEVMNRKLERGWLTLGRAAMLCKLLKLDQMDAAEVDKGMQDDDTQRGLQFALLHTGQVLLEERRRTFWALYILQSYVTTRTGWEFQLGDSKNLQINLPSPGLLRSDLKPLKMPSLVHISTASSAELSSYAGCVLMVELALRCFTNGQNHNTPSFWDDYLSLVKKTDNIFRLLKCHLNATSIREDPVAFSLYLNLRATEIFAHESAIAKNEQQGLPPLLIAESQRRATTAAFQISNAVGLNLPSPWNAQSDIIMLQAVFIAWPLTMALKALNRKLVHGDSEKINGVVASARLLFAALGHIEESEGYWHRSVRDVKAKLQEWDEKNSFDDLALQ